MLQQGWYDRLSVAILARRFRASQAQHDTQETLYNCKGTALINTLGLVSTCVQIRC